MSAALPSQLAPLVEEVRGNPRLQAGLAIIVLVLLGWVLLVLGDWREAKLEELADARERLALVQELAGQQVWLERAEAAGTLAATLEAGIPEAASAGLAQAEFQGWLRELVNSQGVPLRLEVQAPVMLEQPADLVRVTATISGGLPPERVVQMIHRIESRSALSVIPTLIIRTDGLNQTFSLTVQGFYRLSGGEPGGSAGPAPAEPAA